MLSEQNQAENNILIKKLEENHKPTNTGRASKQYFFLQQYFYNTSKNILPYSNNILQYLQWYSIIYLQKYFYHTFHRLYQHSSQIKMIGFIWKSIYLLKENRKEL